MKIALIRHGPTEWNAQGRVQGTIDTDLSTAGRTWLAGLAPPPGFETVRAFVSPRKRAQQTAALLGLSPRIDARLAEQNWGIWEGLTRDEMRTQYGQDCFDRAGIGYAFRPPAGEACFEVVARVKAFLIEAGQSQQDAVAVTHMGVLKAAYAIATGWDMVGTPGELDLRAVLILSVDADGISVSTLNAPMGRKPGWDTPPTPAPAA